jgi:hypothetical protein
MKEKPMTTANRITAEVAGVKLDLALPNPNDLKLSLKQPLVAKDVPAIAAALARSYRTQWEASLQLPSEPAKKVVERDPGGKIIALADRPAFDGPAVGRALADAVEARLRDWYSEALVGAMELALQRDYGSRQTSKKETPR